ncbi:hypothetical protein BC938DRAFT_471276 [Jimgerdemannia flammicorona]|uniref:Uncharacterized protein n=1 Tax=Jimgerdemannia flammicorona TaxID=994334 RepID=A0A433Q8F6_9FUNG|nr:hypothetical protein BC938DRAFT_471276 [Jimgerdemannia flammicorona]
MAAARTYTAISLSPSHKRAFDPEEETFDDYYDEPIPIPSRLFGPINPSTGEPTLFDEVLPQRYHIHSRLQSNSLAKDPIHHPAPNRGGFDFRRFSISTSGDYNQPEEPPKKKRKSTTATIINGVVETVIFTGAVALTAYQLWMGRGRWGSNDNAKVQVQEEGAQHRDDDEDRRFAKLDGTRYGEGSGPNTGIPPPPPYEERWGMVNGVDLEVRSRDIFTQLATIVIEGVFGMLYALYAVLFNRPSSTTSPICISTSLQSPSPKRPFRHYSFLSPPPTPTSFDSSIDSYQPESPTLEHTASSTPTTSGFSDFPNEPASPRTIANARPYHRARGPHSYPSRPTRLRVPRPTTRKRKVSPEPFFHGSISETNLKKEPTAKKPFVLPNPREAEDKALSRMEEKLNSLIAIGKAALHSKVDVESDDEDDDGAYEIEDEEEDL